MSLVKDCQIRAHTMDKFAITGRRHRADTSKYKEETIETIQEKSCDNHFVAMFYHT